MNTALVWMERTARGAGRWGLVALGALLVACAAPAVPERVFGSAVPSAARAWTPAQEARRAALVEAVGAAGVEVLRTPENQLVLRWATDRAFVGDTSEPSAQAQTVWRRVVEVWQTQAEGTPWRARVQAHSDASTADNQAAAALAADRALRLRDLLVDLGVPTTALDVEAWGARAPLMANDTPEGRARNRRVELWWLD